jgi:hypothetical protein
MRATLTVRLELTEEAAHRLRRPAKNHGGFQSLLRTLQAKLTHNNVLTLTPTLAGNVAQYVHKYGPGG